MVRQILRIYFTFLGLVYIYYSYGTFEINMYKKKYM